MHATAAVFTAPDQPLELRTFPFPELREGEVLVEIDCCTVCGSDLHTISGARSVPVPSILGHEIIGRIVDSAGTVRDVSGDPLAIGDRVCWAIAASCGDCFFCDAGIPQKCDQLFKYGHESIDGRPPLSGGLATHCHLVSGTSIVRVPETLSDTIASPAGCATATVAAAFRTAGDCRGRTVVIHGAGMLGLTATAWAHAGGASAVIVSDPDPQRVRRAQAFGATHASIDDLRQLTDHRGADIVMDMSGAPDAMEASINQLRIGGRLILVGAVFPARPLELRADQLVRRMIRVEGVHNYRPQDLVSALEFLTDTADRFPFSSLVSQEFPLEDINRAVADAGQSRAFRIAVRPGALSNGR